MMADEEEKYYIAEAIEPLNEDKSFANEFIVCRKKGVFEEVKPTEVDFMDVSPRQFISAITSLIPFLENDDTVRALTGSNMQRQAVPLLRADSPIVGTGIEHKIAMDSGAMILCQEDGVVSYVDSMQITVKTKKDDVTYKLAKFQK